MQKIFIIGVARTGSKVIRNIVNMNPLVNISLELHWKRPKFINKDASSIFHNYIQKCNKMNSYRELADAIFSNIVPESSFFENIDIDTGVILKKLETRRITSTTLFDLLIEEDAKKNNKIIAGAKFPVNVYYVPWLIKNYPNAKFIHLIRNPYAIYVSMFKKDIKLNKYKIVKLAKFKRLIYIIYQFKIAYLIHKKYSYKKNYILSRFEDLITSPGEQINRLNEFLNIEFNTNMLNPPVVESSYHNQLNYGFDKKVLFRYKSYLSLIEKIVLDILLFKEKKAFLYD